MKNWFLSRVVREKILFIAFVLIGALIWLGSAVDHFRSAKKSLTSAHSDLDAQSIWLGNRETIEASAAIAVQNLDPSRTYDSTALVAEVMALASKAGLSVNTDPPRTQRTSQFAFHTLQVTSRRADFAAIIRFYGLLTERAPYLGLEQLTLRTDGTSGQLDANMQVASVELINQ